MSGAMKTQGTDCLPNMQELLEQEEMMEGKRIEQ